MDWLEYLKLIGVTSLPNALLILAILIVGRKIIENYFESSLENYKTELQLLSQKNALVFGRIHEKKIEGISEIYSKLNLVQISLARLTSQLKAIPNGKTYDEYQDELTENFSNTYRDFIDSYIKYELYLNEEHCTKINNILREFSIASIEYESIRFYRKTGVTDSETMKKAYKESIAASNRVQNEFPGTLKSLKESFNTELQKFEIER